MVSEASSRFICFIYLDKGKGTYVHTYISVAQFAVNTTMVTQKKVMESGGLRVAAPPTGRVVVRAKGLRTTR